MAANVVPINRAGEAETTYDDDDILSTLKQRFRIAEDATQEWRREAIDLYDLVAGKQWSEADKLRMQEALRPALEFNLMGKYIDTVSGLQIANRMDMRYIPREMGDTKVNEILTSAADWARDQCSAWIEESEAWKDMLIGGVGATEDYVDFMDDPEGKFITERRDPIELFWDPSARKINLLDARWMVRVRYMSDEEIEERWPEKADELANPNSMGIEPADTLGYGEYIHHADEAWKYEHGPFGNTQKKTLPVAEYQWFERKPMVRVMTPMGNRDLTPAQYERLKVVFEAQGIPHRAQKFKGKKYFRAFACANVILDQGESPYQMGFTYGFMTGRRDRNTNTWYGIGRSLADPQRFLNKILSEAVHIMQTQAKGGLMAEQDAFADPRRAEIEWAKPDSIVWMEDGSLSNPTGPKVLPKPQSPIPAGFDKFLLFAMQALPETSGLNLEIMGMANKVQPGIVEAQRKQSAMTMIQWAFDSLKRYYEVHGNRLAYYLKEYLSDGRLIRITGDAGHQQYIPLMRDKLTMEFDVVVDESPTSANQKEKTFAVMMELLPIMAQAGQGIPPEFWEHSPLPSELAEKLTKAMQPNPQAVQQQQQAQQLSMAELAAKVKKLESEVEENKADVVLKQQQARKAAAEAGQTMAGL